MAQPDTSASPPAKPIVRAYPTPDLRDRIYVESRDARLPDYKLPDQGAKYEGRDATRYEGWVFATALPADKVGWTDHYYLNERLNQDAYNFSITYPWVDRDYPRYTRTYIFLRADFRAERDCTSPECSREEPETHQTDPVDTRCVLVDWKLERLQDPVQDSLFVGVTKTFERVPAPIKVALDRPESALPFNLRVAVPAIVETQVQEDATDGEAPEIVNEEDWRVEESTDSAFRKTVERTKRVLPAGGMVLEMGSRLTKEQQIGYVTHRWVIGPQNIRDRARLISASVDDIGNNTTVREEVVVPRVFPAGEFSAQIPDDVPPEFRSLLPTRTTGITSEGQAEPPTLGPGELERTSRQETEYIKRDIVTGRELDQLPKTLVDQLIDGISTHGAEHGGVFDMVRTLDRAPQEVQEGFDIIRSSVKNLGSGLTARETERLSHFEGAHLLLTDGGEGYECDPAVVFSGGTFGGGAAGTAVLSAIPQNGDPEEDSGGVFPLTWASNGDANGLFYFLGARYNSGTWRNPAIAGNVTITAISNRPITEDQLAMLVDREPSNTPIFLRPGGQHFFLFDLGTGKTMKVNLCTFRVPDVLTGEAGRQIRLEGSNDNETWTNLTGDITLPVSPINTWVPAAVSDTTAWRYFRAFRTDTHETGRAINLGEIELYGEATISPGINLTYIYNGDDRGVFHYLGKRANNGVWRNPQTNGDIIITNDGTLTGTLDAIVDRQASNVYLDNVANRAFYFDLKPGRTLKCNKLSFRQRTQFAGSSAGFALQGQADLGDPGSWVSLAAVLTTLTPDSWTTVDVTSTVAYQKFRVISADPYLTIGELELYGELSLGPPGPPVYAVTAVNMTDGGENYLTAPLVRFVGGGGTGAGGTAVIENGEVTGVQITNPGINYSSAPEVRFFVTGGGTGATADTNLLLGAVDSIDVTDGGEEYTEAPLVEIIGNGTGATAHAVVGLDGAVTAVVVDTAGSGYTIADVLFRNAGGPVAVAHVGYGLNSITVSASGSNYSSPPAVQLDGDGYGATLMAILGFGVNTVQMTARGDGYSSNPTVVFSGDGVGAAGDAVRAFPVDSVIVDPNGILYSLPPAITVSNEGVYGQSAQFQSYIGRPLLAIIVGLQGSGYTSDPGVTIGGDGTGASATAFRSYALDSIDVDAPGSGYNTATVAISAPTGVNGIQATAHAVIVANAIDSIVIDNPGFGYLTDPTVTISGDGSSATASPNLEAAGSIDHITVDVVGSGFTEPPPVSLSGGGGSGAAISSTIDTSGTGLMTRVDVVNPGFGYLVAPTLTVDGGALATAVISTSGQIVAVTVTSAGAEYTTPPLVSFTGGGGTGGAGLGFLYTIGGVKLIEVINPGTGFAGVPEVTLSGGGGSGATAFANMSSNGEVVSLELIDPGPDYTVAPLVSFFGCLREDITPGVADSFNPIANDIARALAIQTDGQVIVTGDFTNVGGQSRNFIGRVDPDTSLADSWDPNANAIVQPVVIDEDGKVYVGGFFTSIGGQTRNRIARLDPVTGLADSWNPNAGSVVGHIAIQPSDGKIIATGDFTSIGGQSRNKIARLDPTTGLADSWDPNAGNYVHTAVVEADGKVIVGGQFITIGGQSRNFLARIDQSTGLATAFNPNLDERVFVIALQDDGKILIGGTFTTVGGVGRPNCARINTDGTLDTTFNILADAPVTTIEVQADGKVLLGGSFTSILGQTRNRICRLNANGTLDQDFNPNSSAALWDLAIQADGRIITCGEFATIGGETRTRVARLASETEGGTHATALYILGSGWPVLYDTITDPVEGIVVNIEKRIVRPTTVRPPGPGYIDIYAIDKYRSIQITSRIDLTSLPQPENFAQTVNLNLPPLLLSVGAAYSRDTSKSIRINTGFGSSSCKSTVRGKIVVRVQDGFRGGIVAAVTRTFLPYAPTLEQTPTPLVISPSSGTAYITTRHQGKTNSGGTTGQFVYVELGADNVESIDTLDVGGVLTGALIVNSNSGPLIANNTGLMQQGNLMAQNRGIYDPYNIGLAVAATPVSAQADLFLAIPESHPRFLEPGFTFLKSAGVEKWRFGIYVQTLIYVTIPEPAP